MGIVLTKEEFKEKLLKNNPYSKIEVLEFNNCHAPASIKCLECGKIINVLHAENLLYRLNLCDEKHFFSNRSKAEFFSKEYNFVIKQWKTKTGKALIHCNNCHKEFERSYTSLLGHPESCPICNNRWMKQTLDLEEAQNQINEKKGEGYTILQYTSYHKKVLVQHNCGFIWAQKFDSFLISKGCPKCFKNKSKGEQAIGKWLQEKGLFFEEQKNLDTPFKRYKFDFFLKDFNLAIEYQGEQHYKDKSSVWEDLSKIQKRDEIKKKYCLEHDIELFEISYLDFKKIPEILSLKFNDYLSSLKQDEANVKEDIVCSL